MRKYLLLGLLLAFSSTCRAQSQTIVTGTVQGTTGVLATSGYVTFTVKPTSASILYYVAGLNILVPTGRCGINGSGVIKNLALSGDCLVWGNDVITPGNTTYDVQFFPNSVPGQLIHQLLISGTTYSLSAPVFAPQVQINPQYQTIRTSPIAVNLIPASDNVFNIGQAGLRYANGYFNNLTVTNSFAFTNLTVPGNLHVVGTAQLDSAVTLSGGGSFSGLIAGSPILTGTWLTSQLAPRVANAYGLGAPFQPYTSIFLGSASLQYTLLGSLANAARTVNFPNFSGTVALVNVANTWTTGQAFPGVNPTVAGGFFLGGSSLPWSGLFVGGAVNQYNLLQSGATTTQVNTIPDTSGTFSMAVVEYCGATTGGTQACAKTVQKLPLVVFGDVTLNTATSQSITTLPFTSALYSCSGSDLTTAAGVVSFNTYANASVTIVETGGMNTDHLRYMCVGN